MREANTSGANRVRQRSLRFAEGVFDSRVGARDAYSLEKRGLMSIAELMLPESITKRTHRLG